MPVTSQQLEEWLKSRMKDVVRAIGEHLLRAPEGGVLIRKEHSTTGMLISPQRLSLTLEDCRCLVAHWVSLICAVRAYLPPHIDRFGRGEAHVVERIYLKPDYRVEIPSGRFPQWFGSILMELTYHRETQVPLLLTVRCNQVSDSMVEPAEPFSRLVDILLSYEGGYG